MKNKLVIAGLLVVILICFGITFRNLAPVQDDGYRSPRERALLKQFDRDGDGELSKEERKAAAIASAKRKAAFIKEWDTNGDGMLSGEEKEAAGKQRKAAAKAK